MLYIETLVIINILSKRQIKWNTVYMYTTKKSSTLNINERNVMAFKDYTVKLPDYE